MNVIYRVYKLNGNSRSFFNNDVDLLAQEVMMVNSKDEFKEAIRLTYGDDIKFKRTKDLKEGDIFISIISYDCYNAEEYVAVQHYVCANCGKEFLSNKHYLRKLYGTFRLKHICEPLYNERFQEIENYAYCCGTCRATHEIKLEEEFTQYAKENDLVSDSWVKRNDNYGTTDYGYIYMISKKSTGEFYVGQTNAVPMFRWVQHLKTERFKIENITDYKYEVLEVIKDKKDINQREAYWINLKYKENPSLSLNIIKPKLKEESSSELNENN